MGELVHGFFSSCCHVGVCAIFEEVIQVIERFLLTLRGLWWAINFFFKKNPFVPQEFFVPIVH
jgi:hypothetical protein